VFAILFPLAAGSSSSSSGGVSLLLMVAVLGGIFYFFLIRPQQRQRRRQAQILTSLEVGDEVQTIGGMFGTIRALDEETVTVEVAPGIDIKFLRGAIARRLVYDDEGDDGYPEEEDHQDHQEHQDEEAGEQK
jgi:preprotein translocase subunit YajC